MSTFQGLHDLLNVYSTPESYIIEPVAASHPPVLNIARLSGDFTLQDQGEQHFALHPSARLFQAYGVYGIISLTSSEYLILITDRISVGQISGHRIYRATKYEVLPLQNAHSHKDPTEDYLLALVKSHLNTSLLWFSYDWDVTRRLQAQNVAKTRDTGKHLWEICDDRFFWNKHLQSRFIEHTRNTQSLDQDLSAFILPVMCGSIDIRRVSVNSCFFHFALISRRSRYRAGTRYFRRGVDHSGQVANFNETEQLLIFDENSRSSASDGEKNTTTYASFVQTRGSVPLYWAEVNNLRYTPDLQLMELQDSSQAIRSHIQEQLSLYGPQTIVNLLKQKGREFFVNDAFQRYVAELGHPKVRYEPFDFHAECKNMRFDKISALVDRIAGDLIHQGYFLEDESGSRETLYQIGVVRTNCLDNLDRTNVFQSILAKWTLTRQLRHLGILGPAEAVDDQVEFMNIFRNMWADHADNISISYSGTGAMKTDFTRTGTRTKVGVLWDGYNGAARYIKNNFLDGARQDAFDLMTGNWTASRGRYASMALLFDNRPLAIRSMPYVLYFSIFMICAGMTLPRTSDLPLRYYFLLWISIAFATLGYIFAFGVNYVSWPRLIPVTDVLDYEGPGKKTNRKGRGFSSMIPSVGHKKPAMNGAATKHLQPRVNEIEKGK